MKKTLVLLLSLLLASCSSTSEIPSNEPYYCESFCASGWLIAYPNQLFEGQLIKEKGQYYFVNKTLTKHGFHGLLNDKTKIYTAYDTEVKLSDLKETRFESVYASFDPNTYRAIAGVNDVNWISVVSCPMPEIVSEIVIGFDYKESQLFNYIDHTQPQILVLFHFIDTSFIRSHFLFCARIIGQH